jgi:carbamoyl-phosphate synthase small subunit
VKFVKSYLHLANGVSFEGTILTKPIDTEIRGEVVFFTGMTGYQEVLTDPSYKDQIIVFTYPLIGNYGINENDFESKKPHAAGVIVYEGAMSHSHFQAKYSLTDYLNKWDIPLLSRVDTRELVKYIRKEGSMAAAISNDQESNALNLAEISNNTVHEVSSTETRVFGKGKKHIILMDFGYKKSILTSLLQHDCKVTVVPYNTPFESIKSMHPDGILLSNGPGDPKQLKPILGNIKQVISAYPTMSICLGHQLTALAFGGNTKKMRFGHRGANQPVVDLHTERVYMSSQNHSYEVEEQSLKNTPLSVRFRNVNDGTVEGLVHKRLPIITTQYHPEANPGPVESNLLFSEFIQMINDFSGREKAYA